MKTIKKHRKLFIGIAVISALLAAIPVSIAYMVLNSNIGIDLNDTMEEMEAKVDNYFEGNGFTDDIINSMRNKATGDFNIYAMHINSSEFNELEKNMDIITPQAIELNRLEEGKNIVLKYTQIFMKEKIR